MFCSPRESLPHAWLCYTVLVSCCLGNNFLLISILFLGCVDNGTHLPLEKMHVHIRALHFPPFWLCPLHWLLYWQLSKFKQNTDSIICPSFPLVISPLLIISAMESCFLPNLFAAASQYPNSIVYYPQFCLFPVLKSFFFLLIENGFSPTQSILIIVPASQLLHVPPLPSRSTPFLSLVRKQTDI